MSITGVMNNRLFIWQAVISILMCLLMSSPVTSQENVSGYWKFSHIKVTEKEINRKGNKINGISQKGIADDDETIAYFSDCLGGMTYNYSWAAPSVFEGKFIYVADLTWSEIPKILIPGKEYTIFVNAQMTKCIRQDEKVKGYLYGRQMGVNLTISNTLYSSVNVESNIQMEGGFDYAEDTTIGVYSIINSIPELENINSDNTQYRFTPVKADHSGIGWEIINGETQEIFSKIEDNKYAIMIVGRSLTAGCFKHLLYVYKWETGLAEDNIVFEPDREKGLEHSLKATPSNSDIKPDGQSTAEISAILYEYIEGDKNSSKPLAGKTLSFNIKEMDGIKPGKLSASNATTDANGMATVTYTAPTTDLLEKMQPFNRISTSVTIRNEETGVEDIAYITFQTDRGEVFVEPAMGIVSDCGIVPPDKRYPALISCYFEDENLKPIANSEVTFSISGSSQVGMLRASDGREGTQLTVKSNSEGMAEINYFYAADTPPDKPITETIEVRTAKMTIPLKASVAIGFNIVLDNVENGYEGKGMVNAGEEIPLRIKVRDEWNQNLDLAQVMNYWGGGDKTGNNRLYVKLEIEKQGFAPKYILDLLGSQNFPEPLYEELLYPRSFKESDNKNLMYIPESSLKTYGFPRVKPMFSGVNNYEVRVLLTDEKGEIIFESQHPRQSTFISIPTELPADAFSIWFGSNPLGPHTPQARFFRMVLGTVSFGSYGGFGSIISLADAAFAINEGNTEALANILLAEVKNKVLGDASEKTGLSAERIQIYSDMAVVEQYVSFTLTTHSDQGLIAQMENKILSGIASYRFGNDKQMVVLKGDGSQKLFMEAGQKPESEVSRALKDNFKINISGLDKNTKDLIKKVGENISRKGTEIPFEEDKYIYDKKLNTISLKTGNVSIFVIPKSMKVKHEDAIEMKIY